MTNEELLSVAEIVERATNRLHRQAAEHEAKMVEHRASFGARTEADAKLIDGLLTQVQDMREEIIRVNDAHGRTIVERDALRAEVAALQERLRASIARGDFAQIEVAAQKSQTPKQHPVTVGEWVRRIVPFPCFACLHCCRLCCLEKNPSPACGVGTVAKVVHVDDDTSEIKYDVKRIDGQHGVWFAKNCEPCEPPEATHAEPDLTQLHAKGKEAWSDVPNATQWVEELRGNTEVTHDTPEGKDVAESVIRDSRKTEPKPGDTVRLVRIPSRDVVSPELRTVLEWPWIERWGTLNQTAMVVEPLYQLDGAVIVCLSTNAHVRWPINCLEVVTEATHDTDTGKLAAESAAKTEPVADEIKVGDVVEVFQSTASCTFKTDIGTRGTVLQLYDSCVDTAPLDGFLAPKGNHVALCDVRKVTT